MEDTVERLLQKCQVAEQLELELTRPPITCKDLAPILIEYLCLKRKCADLESRLSSMR